MRLLITSSYYWPEEAGTAPWVTGMAEFLSANGHDVAVVTTFPHYPSWSQPNPPRLVALEFREGVEIRRRTLFVPRRQSAGQRALYEASLFACGLTAIPVRRKPDAVLGFIPSLAGGALAATAGALHRRPYGLVIHDLMGPGAEQSGVEGGSAVSRTVQGLELSLARRATGVAIITQGFRDYFEANGVAGEKIHPVRLWRRSGDATESREVTRRRLGWQPDEFICVHAGNMGQKQGLDNLLDAARILEGTSIRIVLVGDGNDRERLRQRAAEMRLGNLRFGEMQPPGLYESVLRAADVLLVNQRPAVGEMSLPSKLTSYFAAGRPVVAAVAPHSETAAEIRAAGAGPVVQPDEPHALVDAIRQLAGDPQSAARHGAGARRYACESLSPTRILADYEAFALAVASSGSPGTGQGRPPESPTATRRGEAEQQQSAARS